MPLDGYRRMFIVTEGKTDEEIRQELLEYFQSDTNKTLVEDAFAAHLLTHTLCCMKVETALERACEYYAQFRKNPDGLLLLSKEDRHMRRDYRVISIKSDPHSVHSMKLRVALIPNQKGERMICVVHGTKSIRDQAWECVRAYRNRLVRQEVLAIIEKRKAGTLQG